MDVHRPSLNVGSSSTALNYDQVVYPCAENRLIGIIGLRGRKLTAISMSIPGIIWLAESRRGKERRDRYS